MSLTAFLVVFIAPIVLAVLLYLPVHLLLRWRRKQREASAPEGTRPKRIGARVIVGALLMMGAFIFGMALPTLAPGTALGSFLDSALGKTIWVLMVFFIAHQFDRWYAKRASRKPSKGGSEDSSGE